MKNLLFIAVAGVLMLLSSFKKNPVATWNVDKNHARVTFSITHNMASDVEGSLRIFDATITTIGDDFSGSTMEFTAEAANITTDNERRDKNIKGPDFLDTEKFPTLTFKSTSVIKEGPGKYKITGNLMLHGVNKSIVLDALVRIPPAETGVKDVTGFKINGSIKRSDFNIGSGFADIVLGEEITISANGEFAKKKQ